MTFHLTIYTYNKIEASNTHTHNNKTQKRFSRRARRTISTPCCWMFVGSWHVQKMCFIYTPKWPAFKAPNFRPPPSHYPPPPLPPATMYSTYNKAFLFNIYYIANTTCGDTHQVAIYFGSSPLLVFNFSKSIRATALVRPAPVHISGPLLKKIFICAANCYTSALMEVTNWVAKSYTYKPSGYFPYIMCDNGIVYTSTHTHKLCLYSYNRAAGVTSTVNSFYLVSLNGDLRYISSPFYRLENC